MPQKATEKYKDYQRRPNVMAENMVTFHRKNPKKMKMVTCLKILLYIDFPN
jgi:hypothetical protein